MIIIDTPFHVTFTSYTNLPSFSCTGKCKKSWFKEELENGNNICPMCASPMQKAVEGVHYKVIDKSNRELKLSDFKKHHGLNAQEKSMLKEVFENKNKIACLSMVKPKFVEKAKAEWC
jgi:acetyl-CoA carboxylase beta subunit